MKQLLLSALIGVIISGVASGQMQGPTSHSTRKSEQQLTALNRALAEAVTKGDAAALDRLFADDIIVTSGSGEIRNKAGEIKDAAASDPDFIWIHPFTTEAVRIKIYDSTAVVTGLAKWTFRYKGPEINQERRYTHLYVKRRGQWKIVAQQMSSNLYKQLGTP